ncbi:MAG: GNAT family N-acetyltransferase [Bacteroidota bacterium]
MQNDRVILRAIEPSDIDFIYTLENNPSNWHISNTFVPFSRYSIEQYILNSDQDIFALKQLRLIIETNDSAQHERIGIIDLFDFDPFHKRVGIGIIILEEHQQKGYAGEALKLVINYCFKTLYLHQCYCNISVKNTTSLNLFKKAGFEVCGAKKEWIFDTNEWIDEQMLQLLNR